MTTFPFPVPVSSASTPSQPLGSAAGGGDVGDDGPTMQLSVGLIVLIVLASLCAILGAIYAYIYYTRINPRSARARKYVESSQPDDPEDGKVTHTHLFLFRKS